MEEFKTVFKLSWIQFYKFLLSPKLWGLAFLVFTLLHMEVSPIVSFLEAYDERLNVVLLPFLFESSFGSLLYTVPLLILLSDLPVRDENLIYVLNRTKKSTWIKSQFIYTLLISITYFLLLQLLIILILRQHGTFSNAWTPAAQTVARTEVGYSQGWGILFTSKILDYFTPWSAFFFSLLLNTLYGLVLGLIVMLGNALHSKSSVGLMLAAGLNILEIVIRKADNPLLKWISPGSWRVLSLIRISEGINIPGFYQILLLYTIIIVALSIIVSKVVKSKDVHTIVGGA